MASHWKHTLPAHHITSHHITSHHITAHHITSHHITSRHTMAWHTTPYQSRVWLTHSPDMHHSLRCCREAGMQQMNEQPSIEHHNCSKASILHSTLIQNTDQTADPTKHFRCNTAVLFPLHYPMSYKQYLRTLLCTVYSVHVQGTPYRACFHGSWCASSSCTPHWTPLCSQRRSTCSHTQPATHCQQHTVKYTKWWLTQCTHHTPHSTAVSTIHTRVLYSPTNASKATASATCLGCQQAPYTTTLQHLASASRVNVCPWGNISEAGASHLAVAWTVKGSSLPAWNGLKTLPKFQPVSGLLQGEDWSRTF